jgi:Leucine Rich Repeat (LRR) protein
MAQTQNFHGADLLKCEYDFMKSLESMMGDPIPMFGRPHEARLILNRLDQDIDAGNHKFTSFIAESTHVMVLVITNLFDKFNSLPDGLENLGSLQALNLNVGLGELPNSIGKLSKLRHLSLGGNKLNTLPDNIGDLKALKTLNLFNNSLKTFPESIANLKNLINLNFGMNNIKTIPPNVQKWLYTLRKQNKCKIGEFDIRLLTETYNEDDDDSYERLHNEFGW